MRFCLKLYSFCFVCRCDHRVGCVNSDVKPLKDNKIFIVLIIPISILIIIILTYKYYQKKKQGAQGRHMAVGENVNQENEIINVSIQYHDTCDSFSEENESETENITNKTNRDHVIDSISENSNSVSGYSHSYEAINSKNIETHEYLSLETTETTDC
ncbi:unnamed protein product [Mytilus coruscus]|uniref:Uncharacterized protein n=1 Tax=Mytilus coruscus TaxID=42192 RepID=A0A6J8BD93_MYTCO|nr:unnamed protein product [Mytilus coruscus]